jgi:hypothetical protein
MPLPTPLYLAAATAIGAAALGASFHAVHPAALQPDSSTLGIVTATGTARSNLAEVGDCVGFILDVTGTEDGVAIQPITATLTGPYAGWPEIGSVADGATVGSFSATWTGAEWDYSAECVSLPVAGAYAWMLDNPNDPEGLDVIIHQSSIVEAVEPFDAGPGDEDFDLDDSSGAPDADDINSDEGAAGTKRPQLAVTGANDGLLLAAAIGGVGGILVGLASMWLRARLHRDTEETSTSDEVDA